MQAAGNPSLVLSLVYTAAKDNSEGGVPFEGQELFPGSQLLRFAGCASWGHRQGGPCQAVRQLLPLLEHGLGSSVPGLILTQTGFRLQNKLLLIRKDIASKTPDWAIVPLQQRWCRTRSGAMEGDTPVKCFSTPWHPALLPRSKTCSCQYWLHPVVLVDGARVLLARRM